ncbi:cobyrinate a,c-diamide synthase [Actinoplanes flavus]|uniref:cobyrinate a,c-diamide synthase n=1 Tax=Actinoplanes flavus TaxID=2820290 RepID=UPI0027DE6BCE|nr:cobyrinate a,c-diamide synthase [Actinoplanes flavus]
MSAPSSGHGKTAIAVGLLAALSGRGIPTAGFKVGPDHTDAAYLGLAAGRPGRNLDPRLVGAQRVAPLFAHGASGAQVTVIEGAMGLFDSLTGQPEVDGTASVAAALRAPVVLVVDVAAMGHSLAALVHGFRMFDEMVHLGGVILNRVASERHEQMLRSAMDDIGMPVLGALHRGDLPNVLPARSHGLVPVAHRTVEAGRAVRRLGEAVASALDMERLMALAASAPPIPGPLWTPAEAAGDVPFDQRPLIALAGGQGAPYTYVETAELLTAAGADVAVVDPLRDEALPPGTRGLVVGAGLPEGYAEELSANRRLCSAVAQFARDGWPVVAEGVALPWLGRELDGRPMCGVLDATATTGEQTVAGYREATAPGMSVLAPAGARITGYKQHRAVVTPRSGANPAWTWSGGNPEGFVWRQVHASQLGLHWAAAPEIARRLVAAAHAGPQGPGSSHPSAGMPPSPSQGMPPGPPSGQPQGVPSGPQGVPSGPQGSPPGSQGMPAGSPSGMPPGMVPSGHPAMAPAGAGLPPVQGSPAGPGTSGTPAQGVPDTVVLTTSGPGSSSAASGMPHGMNHPGHGAPGSGLPGADAYGQDFPGHDAPGQSAFGSDRPERGEPGQGTFGPDFPERGVSGQGGFGPDFPERGVSGQGGFGPDFPERGASGQGGFGPDFPERGASSPGPSGSGQSGPGGFGPGSGSGSGQSGPNGFGSGSDQSGPNGFGSGSGQSGPNGFRPGSGLPGHGGPGQGMPTSPGPAMAPGPAMSSGPVMPPGPSMSPGQPMSSGPSMPPSAGPIVLQGQVLPPLGRQSNGRPSGPDMPGSDHGMPAGPDDHPAPDFPVHS